MSSMPRRRKRVVWVAGDGYRPFDAVRYEVEWITVKPSAQGKEDVDPDFDTVTHCEYFPDKAAAMKYGQEVFDREAALSSLCWGVVTVSKQVIDWLSEDDGIAEWTDGNESEEIS